MNKILDELTIISDDGTEVNLKNLLATNQVRVRIGESAIILDMRFIPQEDVVWRINELAWILKEFVTRYKERL